MHDYYEKSMRALQLAGLGKSTQKAYTRAVRKLVDYCGKTPDKITEEEIEAYFLHRRNVDGWSASTMGIAHYGIKFFFTNVLKQDFHLFSYLKARREKTLPCILSREEVFRILNHVTTPHNLAFYHTVYACGLRLSEGLNLRVSDIDSARMMLHVHRGKGAKDRYVPLPEHTLGVLRQYWLNHRNPTLIFPARGRGNTEAPTTDKVMSIEGVQGAFRKARYAAGIMKRRVSIHTLRHCYATHLLEAGVNPRVVQRYMGHSNLETTMAYFHLTQKGIEDSYRIINHVMRGDSHEQDI
ncbi:site-specific integrase [Desulfoluna butyratoxydans]|uniref:Integrase catalytic domain n=2 Tax=Desulfoluna butyratoxydans TaxID=231438 RepID=A0A4U8YSY6_9BACT|nr:site-specific integrase [Desulfoluna butyratoxydans]VFQ47516.1 integrase catalytic domain [Desulfoluna butyratoxydans]